MAYVNIPKDLSTVRSKIAFNLTKRQILCLIPAAAVGLALYFLTRKSMGTTLAATLMVMVMTPGFFFAMYERKGRFTEQILRDICLMKFKRPAARPYITENRQDRKEDA